MAISLQTNTHMVHGSRNVTLFSESSPVMQDLLPVMNKNSRLCNQFSDLIQTDADLHLTGCCIAVSLNMFQWQSHSQARIALHH